MKDAVPSCVVTQRPFPKRSPKSSKFDTYMTKNRQLRTLRYLVACRALFSHVFLTVRISYFIDFPLSCTAIIINCIASKRLDAAFHTRQRNAFGVYPKDRVTI